MTCETVPELLLNKSFVARHCATDEHLFMLVMHELYHVILGHTALFPRPTEIHNLAFDAVINAMLCTLFPDPAFTSFFTDFYPSDEMPYALLRPKGDGTPPAAEAALRLLYDKSGTATYHDVFQALVGCLKVVLVAGGAGGADGDEPCLLGSHGKGGGKGGDDSQLSSEMKALIETATSKWPHPPRTFGGRGAGSREENRDFGAAERSGVTLRRGVARLMRRASLPGPREVRAAAVHCQTIETATFLPEWRDRTHPARELALGDALLYRGTCVVSRRTLRDDRQAFVYFDVSGSVADDVPSVAAALLPHCRRGRCRVHVFSTIVRPASVRDLAANRFSSTGGTSINCVMEHVLALPPRRRPHSVVVITDGDTGKPKAEDAARFRAAGMRLYVGLVGSCRSRSDLSSLATEFIELARNDQKLLFLTRRRGVVLGRGFAD